MKAVKPTALTSAMLISTTATEVYSAWNPVTSYALDDIVLLTSTQRLYQRLVPGTTATSPELDTTNWLDIGPTNKWAMFDSEISTLTTATTTLTTVLAPGYVNSLALFGLVGQTLTVTVRDGLAGPVVYGPEVITLDGTIISDWYMYFFEPSVQLAEVVLTDLPPYQAAHITITLDGTGTVACGICLAGTFYSLGDTEFGANVSIIDYSRKETDAFGVTTFVQRAYSKRMSARMMLDTVQINKVQRVLADLRATPCAWIGTDESGFEPLTVYGFYRDFSIDVAYPTKSYCSLEVEGLT
jgi:hypothetical protein